MNIPKFLRNHIRNYLLNPAVKFPSYAYITIESVCNSRCNYCDMWKTKKGEQPTVDEWKTIIDDIHSAGAVTLTFSGGEPFLNKDLFELASYAKSLGLATMVVTNLSLFNKSHIEKIAKSFDFFGTSIDSTKPEVYKEIRGVDWLERNKKNIRKLMSGLAEIKAETIVCAMVTVSNRNAEEMHELLHMIFDELKMDAVSFNELDPQGGTTAKDFSPTAEQIEMYKKVVLNHKSIYPINNSRRYISQSGNFNYRCNPWKCIQIDHEGNLISPCLFKRDSVINLREHRLSDIWKLKDVQQTYAKYSNCNKCNLGCVAEAAWSTYDIGFIINESLLGMIIPTMKRIRARNKKAFRKR